MNTAIFFALIALISFVKEKIVNDVIFSEILSKPKSKR